MSACAPTVYTELNDGRPLKNCPQSGQFFKLTDHAPREFRDFTEAIKSASTHEERLKLLAEKQLLHPPRLPHVRSERAEADDVYTTRNGQDWREILAEKQRHDRIRRRDCVSVADIEVAL